MHIVTHYFVVHCLNDFFLWLSHKVLSRALMFIPQLGKYAESILENGSSSGRKLAKLQAIGRQAVAALCALGGFKETIKIGSEVQVSFFNRRKKM